MKRTFFALLIGATVLTAGCAGKNRTQYQTVQVPPHIDLTAHELIAVIQFDSSGNDELGPLATRRFTDFARRDQGLVRMLRVDDPETDRRDSTALRQIGERHGARSVFIGRVEISDVRPNVSIARTLRSGSVTANVDATLTVDLVETETGASIWSASARVTREIGHLSVYDGKRFTIDAEDPEQAYGSLVDALVGQVTRDFQARRVRQPIPR
ncbi:MAG: hypothetical protein GTN89_16455 [Acidobacteria bacterium]|nr:hypothetical protein [Acidobacteriota bacterium]NIO60818.1 hypothetical protein [Acidobacteriota bacterium]NIQ31890.1 hypothetical protein [Acidobacteriota bacterium]NIQ87270.1 hypothetical protein [Acidobacteriota bacterium]NIT12486.1 hypothetical protein [Acidobacteriota bacterium]